MKRASFTQYIKDQTPVFDEQILRSSRETIRPLDAHEAALVDRMIDLHKKIRDLNRRKRPLITATGKLIREMETKLETVKAEYTLIT